MRSAAPWRRGCVRPQTRQGTSVRQTMKPFAAIAPDDEAGKKGAEAAGHCGAAVPAAQMAGGEPGQPGRPHHKPGGEPGNGTADGGFAGSVNGSAAAAPRDRRKSCLPNDLPLPGYDFASVYRSATLPNEVLQKGGAEAGRRKAKGGRRKPVSQPAQESAPRRGSAATLMRELDRVLDGQGASQSFPGLGGYQKTEAGGK